MHEVTPEPRRCEVCGDPLRSDNKSGICSNPTKTECVKARTRKAPKRPSKPRPKAEVRKCCEVCGKPLRSDAIMGVCGGRGKAACQRERRHRKRDGFVINRGPLVTVGQVFDRWTALETCTFGTDYVLCRCECGTERRVLARWLTLGTSHDCGCAWRVRSVQTRHPGPYMRAGAVFGRLTVLEDVARSDSRAPCRCECGNEKTVLARVLNGGRTRSCGCLHDEVHTTHGLSGHPLYETWHGMVDRCTNPNSESWPSYGGRGITVCKRWCDLRLFVEDIERELEPRPVGWSLDRIDNEKGYFASNVRWADKKTQRQNQRTVGRLTLERDALAAELAALKASLGLS